MEVDNQLLGLLGQGGVTAALLYLIWKVGMAMVAAIKEQGAKLDKHTLDENEHHTLVREELAALRAHHGIPTPVHGIPVQVGRQPSQPVLAVVPRADSKPDE